MPVAVLKKIFYYFLCSGIMMWILSISLSSRHRFILCNCSIDGEN